MHFVQQELARNSNNSTATDSQRMRYFMSPTTVECTDSIPASACQTRANCRPRLFERPKPLGVIKLHVHELDSQYLTERIRSGKQPSDNAHIRSSRQAVYQAANSTEAVASFLLQLRNAFKFVRMDVWLLRVNTTSVHPRIRNKLRRRLRTDGSTPASSRLADHTCTVQFRPIGQTGNTGGLTYVNYFGSAGGSWRCVIARKSCWRISRKLRRIGHSPGRNYGSDFVHRGLMCVDGIYVIDCETQRGSIFYSTTSTWHGALGVAPHPQFCSNTEYDLQLELRGRNYFFSTRRASSSARPMIPIHGTYADTVMPVPVPSEGRTKVELEDWKDYTVDSSNAVKLAKDLFGAEEVHQFEEDYEEFECIPDGVKEWSYEIEGEKAASTGVQGPDR
ncbi:hypothetical protein BC629DRAFT_1439081 [Irpex lacteus]|nr:hypothetical protein BC629DRAFT_1439081 [Irpex lacteus]